MSDPAFDEFVLENFRFNNEVRSWFRDWLDKQEDRVKDNLGFFVFPEMVQLGCTIVEQTSVFASNDKTKAALQAFEQFETQIIADVGEMVIDQEVRFRLDQFNSHEEVQLYFDALGEDLKFDFFDWFTPHSQSFFETHGEDMRKVICLLFSTGFTILCESFSYLVDSVDDYPEFSEQVKQYYVKFLIHCSDMTTTLKQGIRPLDN